MKPQIFPNTFRRYLPADHPQSMAASDKAMARHEVGLERELHETFINWCNLNGIPFIHSRMDRKSTIAEGWPDFTLVFQGKAACIEFKVQGNKLSAAQADCVASLKLCGVPVLVTTKVTEAIEFVKGVFGI